MATNLGIAVILFFVSLKMYKMYQEKLNPGISKFYYCLMAWAICNIAII